MLCPFSYRRSQRRKRRSFTRTLCFFSDNFLEIDIYYGQLKSVEVEQKSAYDLGSFFSK